MSDDTQNKVLVEITSPVCLVCLSSELCGGRCWRRGRGVRWRSVILVSVFCSWHPSIPPPFCRSFVCPSDDLQPVMLLSATLLRQGGVDSGGPWPRAGAGHLCIVGLRLGDGIHAGGQNVPARLGSGACRSRWGSSRGRRLWKAAALPGLCGGAALWTLLYYCVELTLSAVRAFSCNHSDDVSVCKSNAQNGF